MEKNNYVESVHQSAQEYDKNKTHCHFNQKEEREEATLMQQNTRRPNLSSLEIPARSLESTLYDFARIDIPSPTSTKAGLPPRPNSAKLISSVKNLLPQRSFRGKHPIQDGEKTVLIIPDTPKSGKPSTSRSFSLNKFLFSSSTKTHSLPVTPMANVEPKPSEENNVDGNYKLPKYEVRKHMTRSFSVPVHVRTRILRQTDSPGGLIRVISAVHRSATYESASVDISQEIEAQDDTGEDIPEEEAVCRILIIMNSLNPMSTAGLYFTSLLIDGRVWQDVPVLVMVSVLAYFCFLEQLVVSDMGPRALAISLPFSCALGLLSSMISSTMGKFNRLLSFPVLSY
ncbi:E3 ubiquitin- ligase MARCH10 [Olea europaea subsp. europaea]|uniref:E3 ubiquitin- ligase MARCH10 n=1 Tax=Olea europaea subsp. europaea TaxID=158383 RepID=A0A8S0RUB3_OLEEU|nr:E3 ubiquitin- ligase MARCH10 [Olea europaea subsp. europaea]